MSDDNRIRPVIVLKPGVATEADKDLLREAGYVVLESDLPDPAVVLEPLLSQFATQDQIFLAAIKAVKSSEHTCKVFGASPAEMLAKKQ